MYLIIGIIIFISLLFFLLNNTLEIHENFKDSNDLKDSNNSMIIDKEIEKIPKIIIQTWKDNNIPDRYIPHIESLKDMNPSYQYMYFTDNDIDVFLKKNYPEYYKTYNELPVFIQKIDFFRYIAVYHYGGFYFDLDMTGLKPLDDELLTHDSVFPIDTIITDDNCTQSRYKGYCDVGMDFLLGQYAFGSKKKDPFIKELIDTIHNNIEQIKERYKIDQTRSFVYQTTGPDYVTDIYLKYKMKKNIYILKSDKNQYFGDYAKHNYFGTWK